MVCNSINSPVQELLGTSRPEVGKLFPCTHYLGFKAR